LARREEQAYPVNHLQLAGELVGQWQLDSFLVDAISFLHVEIEQIESNGPLLKIARLAQQFCPRPEQLAEETRALSARLFGFRPSEIDYLFDWAHGLYQGCAPALADEQQLRKELTTAQNRLAELTFVLADLEGVRARLASCPGPQDLVREARQLYLESSVVNEAVFLLVDQKNNQLIGIVSEGQARMIGELKVPLESSASLAARALLAGRPLTSFTQEQPLTLIDHQLQRLCQGKGICCLPFRFEGRPLGVVALGLASAGALEGMQNLRLQMFGQVISNILAHLTDDIQDRFLENNSLLRRVSHELSNPLTIIGNYAEVLNHHLEDQERSELTETIKKELRRIDDILNYYLNQQEMPFFPGHRVNLNQLVMEATEALQPTDLEPRRIEVRYEFMADLPQVPTNAVLVKQVLVNLIKNAAEAAGEDGVINLATRETYCADGDRLAEIVVHDNGPGIDPKIQDKLFRPVVSTKGISHAGVGLSVVKSMVDDLQGRISCHSSPTTGTGFYFQIPCEKSERATAK
jgi:signal transduction histidine kinase